MQETNPRIQVWVGWYGFTQRVSRSQENFLVICKRMPLRPGGLGGASFHIKRAMGRFSAGQAEAARSTRDCVSWAQDWAEFHGCSHPETTDPPWSSSSQKSPSICLSTEKKLAACSL
jgi:hypothetical protein